MDLVAILERSASELPDGDYSIGLNAIVRHVKAAIRHLERDQSSDPDTCTDAIYRMNQAYEGSLKEAYRVLAEKDPAKLSPAQIENYLESSKVVRPRVALQLTRYRQDYRNPSTHDYKLDFDADEALLAIVSVCAFAKLLIDQIRSKVASKEALARIASSVRGTQALSLELMAEVCFRYTVESVTVGWFEFEQGVTDALVEAGFEAELFTFDDDAEIVVPWDIVVRIGDAQYGIDARVAKVNNEDAPVKFEVYTDALDGMGMSGIVLMVRAEGMEGFQLIEVDNGGVSMYIICSKHEKQIEDIRSQFDNVRLVS